MSLKVNQFVNVITNPLNIHNFVIDIPGADATNLVVQATAFPSEQLQEVTLHFQGEEIRYPTIPKNSHSWRIKVPENDDGKIKNELEKLKSAMWNQKTGIFIPKTWKNIPVYARDLAGNIVFKVILHGAWLVGRSDVSLDNSNPNANWSWDYEFRYQWIEDSKGSNKAPEAPMKANE